MCACTEPVRTGIGAVCVEHGRPKWPITMLNHTNKQINIPGTGKFLFVFLAPYARTARYEEAFLPEGKKRPRSLRSLGLAMLNLANKPINKQINKHPWYRRFFFFFLTHYMLLRSAMKRLYCLKAKNSLGRFAASALP